MNTRKISNDTIKNIVEDSVTGIVSTVTYGSTVTIKDIDKRMFNNKKWVNKFTTGFKKAFTIDSNTLKETILNESLDASIDFLGNPNSNSNENQVCQREFIGLTSPVDNPINPYFENITER